MPNSSTIWTTKNPAIEYDTFEISHSAFSPVRIYASYGDEENITILGNEYRPCYVEVDYPVIDGESTPDATFSMSRAVVGDEVQRLIKSIPPYKRITEPVKVTLAHWTSLDLSAPMFTYTLDVANDGVAMSVDTVTIKCEITNIMTRSVARIYEIDEWSGLELS